MSIGLGSGPLATTPVFATDEEIYVRCTGDFGIIAPPSQMLAAGTDGVFAPGSPWILNSDTNNFQSQGVLAQTVVWLQGPAAVFRGTGIFLAVDSASGNALILRRPMQPLWAGMPPAPAAGITGVTFTIQTLYPQIEEASYYLKTRFMVDEAIAYRSSSWLYKGVEDPYRSLRRLCILKVLVDRYTAEVREERGDFEMKRRQFGVEYKELFGQVQVKFGPMGNSAEAADIFSTKISR
jgi:hypothetical protein